MPEKKNQHFVPQFYLRNFSTNEDETTIGIFVKEKDHFFTGASIADQASKNYFYGKDLTIENLLGKIENKVQPIIEDIVLKEKLPANNSANHLVLMSFISLMSLRTLSAVEMVDETWEKSLIKIFKHEDLIPDEAKVNSKTSISLVFTALESTPLLMDLDLKLLKNNSAKPFITSDHPAVKYNQFFEPKDTIDGQVGLASKGIQIFLPITPDLLLVAYDGEVYSCDEKTEVVKLENLKDVVELNSLQMINSNSTTYFNYEMHEQHLKYLKRENEQFFFSEKSDVEEFYNKNENSSLIRWNPKAIECNLSLSFLKLSKEGQNFSLDERTVYARNLEFAKELRSINEEIKAGKCIPRYMKVLLN